MLKMFSKRLKEIRIDKNLSHSQFAQSLGVTKQSILGAGDY